MQGDFAKQRVVASDSYWKQPLTWNRKAKKAGERQRVFCASLADVFETWDGPMVDARGEAMYRKRDGTITCNGGGDPGYAVQATMDDVRLRLFELIDATPHLDWLLLTKRPENIRRMWPATTTEAQLHTFSPDAKAAYGETPTGGRPVSLAVKQDRRSNVWLGCSLATQADADKNIPELLKCRDLAPVLFVSAEPLIEAVDLSTTCINPPQEVYGVGGPYHWCGDAGIDWCIVGGESGPRARLCNVAWIRSIVEQCRGAGVACFVKQLGSVVIDDRVTGLHSQIRDDECWPKGEDTAVETYTPDASKPYLFHDRVRLSDSKGGAPADWPEDLRVRQFPNSLETVAGTS